MVSLCDRHGAMVLNCSALLYEYIYAQHTCRQAHIQLHTGINTHASVHTLASASVFANTLKMDCSGPVVTIQAAITVTGRTFN